MSSHYIYLSCPASDCSKFEQIYTGDIYTNDFPDSGPRSFEGEAIETPCNEHLDWEPEPVSTAADQPTTEPSAPWADEPTTWIEDDHFPDKVKICQGTRASSSAIRIPRDAVPLLIEQLTALAPAPQPAADTERVERLRAARAWAAGLRRDSLLLPWKVNVVALDEEVTRVDAVEAAVRGVVGRNILAMHADDMPTIDPRWALLAALSTALDQKEADRG